MVKGISLTTGISIFSPNLENDDLTETINCINEAGENIKLFIFFHYLAFYLLICLEAVQLIKFSDSFDK